MTVSIDRAVTNFIVDLSGETKSIESRWFEVQDVTDHFRRMAVAAGRYNDRPFGGHPVGGLIFRGHEAKQIEPGRWVVRYRFEAIESERAQLAYMVVFDPADYDAVFPEGVAVLEPDNEASRQS